MGVLEIFTAPIQPSGDNSRETPPFGYFVVGKILDDQYLQKIADVADLSVAIVPPDTALADLEPGAIIFAEPLPGVEGEAVAVLYCRGDNPLYATYTWASYVSIIVLLVLGCTIFSLLVVSLHIWLGRPLNKISTALEEGDENAVTSLTAAKSEFGRIARLIKEFFEQQTELEEQIKAQSRARKSLAESENRYRVVLKQTGQLIYDWDVTSGKIIWSGAIASITGFSDDEYQRVDIDEWERMIHPEDRPDAVAALDTAAVAGSNYNVQYRLRRKDGSYIFVEDNGVFIVNDLGESVRMLGTMRDITDRRWAEEALRESEAAVRNKLKAIIEPEGDLGELALTDIIDVATFQNMMEVFNRITGIASAIIDTDGKVLVSVGWQDICTRFHRCHPETLKNCIESDTILTQGVAPGTFKTYRCKNNLVDMATPIILNGKHLGNFFIGQYLYEEDPPDVEIFRNQARRYGFDENEYLAALDGVPRYNKKLADEIMTFYFKFTGMISTLSFSTIQLARTLTERQQAEDRQKMLQEQLEKAQRMESLAVLAGGVAHDLNNMLGPVVGYSELLLRTLPQESDATRKARRIMKSAEDAAEVIQDLLTLARRGRYEKKVLDLNQIVLSFFESVGFQRLKERHKDAEFITRLSEKPCMINGSRPHLEKVLMNLVANGCEAMANGGKLTIETEERYLTELIGGHRQIDNGRYILLRVKDDGSGIEKNDLQRIFEPYFSKKHLGNSGSGLGLSVVYGVVKDHGGYYDVFSEIGKGTEFIMYFPVSTVPIETSGTEKTTFAGGTESILIVDDSAEQREMANDMVACLGYNVHTVANGHEAIAFLRAKPVDLLVLDMIMEPDFDGLATYREAIKIRPGQKAIIVSGFSATSNVQELQKLGAGSYVRKPYTLESIARAIRNELDAMAERDDITLTQTVG
jgi:PAS domain S-box-containing protein